MRQTAMKRLISLFTILICTATAALSQNRIDSIAYRAMQVGRVMQQERVFLHFDNTAYYLGETMWFKAYTTFGTDDRPSTLSKVLYVELVAPEGYVVETKKYKLDEQGSCYGEFELNPLLLSGYYEVRAYTRYMLNWGKDAVFTRVFPIFDKVNAVNWDFRNLLDRRRGFNERGKWMSAELPDATLDFFPEGGELVAGIESRIAYELRGKDGQFSEERITIYEGDTKLLESTPQHYGKGAFTITPKKDTRYRAEVTMSNEKGKSKVHKFKLPEVFDEGATLRVDEIGDSIVITVQNNMTKERNLGVAILYRGALGFFKKSSSNDKVVKYIIPKQELPEGVNRVVLFENEHTPLAERQFFVEHNRMANGDRGTVKLNITANGYHTHNLSPKPGEKITLKLTRDDGKAIPAGTDLSLAVSDAAGRQVTSYSHNLYSYLLLGSELKGYIPDATQYFDSNNPKRKEQLDLLMLTHGWTSYNWHMLTREKIENLHPIERGISLKGKFYQKQRNTEMGSYGKAKLTPQSYNLTRVDIPTDSGRVETTTFRTDSTGAFMIEFDDFYGTRIASLSPQTVFKQSQNISYQFGLDRYYSPGFRLYDYWERNLGEAMSKQAADSLVRVNPFEYMLSAVDVVAKRKNETNSRPPHSEMRFNYLDEWEYAQDVTFLDQFDLHEDDFYTKIKEEALLYESGNEDSELAQNVHKVGEGKEVIYNIGQIMSVGEEERIMTKYIGNMRLGSEAITITVNHDYDHTLTAADVVTSAMKRHNYNWAYWVQLMVVLGEYSPYSVPKPDMEYLRGLADADKMTNFKEFVIRSDEGTRKQFENRDTHWEPLSRMLDNKLGMHKFYLGFLSQMYLYASEGYDGCPGIHRFNSAIMDAGGGGINYPANPNYVACLIPYSKEEKANGIVPEYAATGSSLRYTSVQGYSRSKQFYSPNYGKMTPQEKDYRRTLLWVPQVSINDNGEAIVELYNSSNCYGIVVDVAGRHGTDFYSSDATTTTRIDDGKSKSTKKSVSIPKSKEETPMSEEMRAACAYEHEKGVIYYNKGNYKEAIRIFAELVQYKYAPAMFYVSECYRHGRGVAKNPTLSLKFLLEAAKQGDAAAQYTLGCTLQKSESVERNDSLAHHWFCEAAQQNEPRAVMELAHRYRDGFMVERDSAKYEELVTKAAKMQEPAGLYEQGVILNAKGKDGTRYIAAAAEKLHPDALLYMVDYEEERKQYKAAYRYAKALSELGYHEGTKRMADYYYDGKGVPRDRDLARDLYFDAANAGNNAARERMQEIRK